MTPHKVFSRGTEHHSVFSSRIRAFFLWCVLKETVQGAGSTECRNMHQQGWFIALLLSREAAGEDAIITGHGATTSQCAFLSNALLIHLSLTGGKFEKRYTTPSGVSQVPAFKNKRLFCVFISSLVCANISSWGTSHCVQCRGKHKSWPHEVMCTKIFIFDCLCFRLDRTHVLSS